MARPKEFDSCVALERAMEVFWAKGYEGTSLNDLLAAMELSKSSLYETFGSKHELFLAALDRYRDTRTAMMIRALEDAETARSGVQAVFDQAVETAVTPGKPRGCFLNNCAVEVDPSDKAALQRVRGGVGLMEEAFRRRLEQGQAAGEIAADHDASALARYLNSTLMGLAVMGKANPDREKLEEIVKIALQALKT